MNRKPKKEQNEQMQPDSQNHTRSLGNIISFVGLIFCVVVALWGYKSGCFHSVSSLQTFVKRFGGAGIVFFVLFQIVQVVFPILPGGISCLAGVLLYGSWVGFLCNYVGICMGSMVAFGIAKNLGRTAFEKKFSKRQIQIFESWTSKDSRFLKMFAIAIFFPVAPDDLLCYLAGTTAMTWRQFICIILLGKPFSIALYSMGLTGVFRVLQG